MEEKGMHPDLSEYENMKKLKEFYEKIVFLLPGHVYWKDRGGKYMGCNDLQAQDLGLSSKDDIIGKTDYELSVEEEAEGLRKTDLEVMESGVPQVLEEIKILDDGAELVYLSEKVPLKRRQRQYCWPYRDIV